MTFDISRKEFEFEFRHDTTITAPTELFVPNYQYPGGYAVEISDGSYEIDRERQIVVYRHSEAQDVHTIRVTSSVSGR